MLEHKKKLIEIRSVKLTLIFILKYVYCFVPKPNIKPKTNKTITILIFTRKITYTKIYQNMKEMCEKNMILVPLKIIKCLNLL